MQHSAIHASSQEPCDAPLDAQTLAAVLDGALSANPEQRQACETILTEWEQTPHFCSTLLMVYASPPDGLSQESRLLAVLCVKNAVARNWHQRRQDQAAIPVNEKSMLKANLLHTISEPNQQIWAQLELLMANIGRLDGLAAWPELVPKLLDVAKQADPRAAARGLGALYRVAKQQASRRLLAHRKQFFAFAEHLWPHLQPIHTMLKCRLLDLLDQQAPSETAAWLLRADTLGGSHIVHAVVALCKLDRQLLLHGWAHLHEHPEPCEMVRQYLSMMVRVEAQQRRLCGDSAGSNATGAAAARCLMPLLLLPAKLLLDVQELQALAMTQTLADAITFFVGQLQLRPCEAVAEQDDERFLVRALMFLRSALSTSSYVPTRQAPPQAHTCRQVLHAFFESASLPEMVSSILMRALPLTSVEYEEYCDDPETVCPYATVARHAKSIRHTMPYCRAPMLCKDAP